MEKIKRFFKWLKTNAVTVFIIGVFLFVVINFNKLKNFILSFFYAQTNDLRDKKDKKNKEYAATNVGEANNTKKPKRKTSTKTSADKLIEKNKKMIERLKNEK